MADRLDLHFRAHTVPLNFEKESWANRPATLPKQALILRCVTTSDERKDLLFGAYICARLEGAEYIAEEIGLFHRDSHPEELRVLKRFVKGSAFELGAVDSLGVHSHGPFSFVSRADFLFYLDFDCDGCRGANQSYV